MTLLLDKQIIITQKDDKTNISIDLTTDRNFEALEFSCVYSPKTLDDLELSKNLIEEGAKKYIPERFMPPDFDWKRHLPLNNHVTFSLDYNGEYVGCAHRHAPKQTHRISRFQATRGFFKTDAAAGHWRIVLNVHCIITNEILYHLKVTGLEKGEA